MQDEVCLCQCCSLQQYSVSSRQRSAGRAAVRAEDHVTGNEQGHAEEIVAGNEQGYTGEIVAEREKIGSKNTGLFCSASLESKYEEMIITMLFKLDESLRLNQQKAVVR